MSAIVAVGVLALLQQGPMPQSQSPWVLGGTPNAGYRLTDTSGTAITPQGARLSLRADSVPTGAFGSIVAMISAENQRSRRVRVEADIDAKDVSGGATPWIRADGPNGMLVLDNGLDHAVKGTATAHLETSIYVPANATRIAFGLLLSGKGEATARGLRLVVRPATSADAPLAPAAQLELDSAIAIAKHNSLWRDTVSWSIVEPEVRRIAAGADRPAEVHPAIRTLLARLGDHHSFLMLPSGAQAFQTGGAQNPRATVKLLPEKIGYVSVPAYSGGEANASREYAKNMQDSLAAVAPAAGCRWVVDLRANGGGNMWPMLGGLRPFLGEEGLGSFVTAGGHDPLWHANAVDVPPPPSLARLESANVAVLTGPRTGSSGEAVTISFIGRPHTRLFGLPTAGLSTANQGFTLPDGGMIFLTVSVEADRNGKRYGEKIQPDEIIPPAATNSSDDPQLARALAWLKQQACTP